MDNVTITGASGLVGSALRASIGRDVAMLSLGSAQWRTNLEAASLEDATVYHLAARVHHVGRQEEADYHRDNAVKTRALAETAARKRARRLVFLSTIKVNGEETPGRAFARGDIPAPHDAYARSKLAAERALSEIAASSALEVVIVRSPLVLGAGARGNLDSVLRLAASPLPLPFAALDNRRSFVHVDDLARLLLACGAHPAALGKTYFAAHHDPFSTRRLFATLRRELGRRERLFAIAPRALERLAALAGQGERVRRLTRSLEVDASAAQHELGWIAQVSFEQAAREMAQAFLAGARK